MFGEDLGDVAVVFVNGVSDGSISHTVIPDAPHRSVQTFQRRNSGQRCLGPQTAADVGAAPSRRLSERDESARRNHERVTVTYFQDGLCL